MKTTSLPLILLVGGLAGPGLGLAQPTILLQPKSQSVSLGANVTFRVSATGTAPLTYQWRHNGADISGATANPLTLTNVQLVDAGDYSVVVTDSTGSITSNAGTLGVDPAFTKITTGSIVTEKGEFTGCAWGDYNSDGWPDLFVNNRPAAVANLLYRNNRDGTFTKVTNANLIWESRANHMAGVWGDYDNDGLLDLLAVNGGSATIGHMVLYRNNGDGTFSRPGPANLGSIATRTGGFHGAAWGDYDGEGFLDVFVTDITARNYLYRNLAGIQFDEVREPSGQPAALGSSAAEAAWADYDNDAHLDLLVISRNNGMMLYQNDGQGRLLPATTGLGVSEEGVGCSWGDFNNDGFFDLYVSNSQRNLLYANQGDGTFLKITNRDPVKESADTFGAAWGDYDNDGLLDLFVANGAQGNPPLNNSLYHNKGDGTFEKISTGSLVNDQGRSLGCAWSDYDNDGFLDLFVSNGYLGTVESNFLYRNNGSSNGWLKVRCVGTISNRAGIGAKVRVRAAINGQPSTQLRQIASSDGRTGGSLEAHFGLGDATIVETLRIEWPSGIIEEFRNVAVKQTLTVIEPPRLQARLEAGQLRVSLPGGKGFVYEVQSSSDLINWTAVETLTNTTGQLEFTDPTVAQQPRRFYRAVVK